MRTIFIAEARWEVALGCVAMLTVSASSMAYATVISPSIVVSSLQLAPSSATQNEALNVFFSAPPQLSLDIAGFQLSLTILGPDDSVRFTGVSAPQGKPYLFAPVSTVPFASVSLDGSRLTFGDFLNSGYGQASNDQGLATIQVSILPSAVGKSYVVAVDLDPTESFLGISSTNLLPVTAQNGTISIVPEPSGLVIAVVIASATGVARSRRNKSRPICYCRIS